MTVTRIKLTICLLFSLTALLNLGYVSAQPQPQQVFESISIAEGLSQGMVFDILQDKDGFIWVATKNGLNRYDGYRFKVFTNDPYDPHTLSSNTTLSLFEDSKGRIWIGTENGGLNVYDKKSGRFYRIEHHATDPGSLSGNTVRRMVELPDGRIMVGADDAGLDIIKLSDGFFEKDMAPVITRLSLPNDAQVYGMGKDKNNDIWVGGFDNMVYRFDPLKNSFTKLENGRLFNNGYVNEQDGSTLINNDLFLSDGKDVYPLFDITKRIPGNVIFNPREKLWNNHHRELYFYDVSLWQPGKPVKWNADLPANMSKILCYPFMIDRSGMLWNGTIGYGLRKYNTASTKFKTQLPGFSVRFIVPVSDNDIFLGNYAYDWRRLTKDSIAINPFSKLPFTEIDNFIVSKKGDYWIKSDNKGYYRYNPEKGELIALPQVNFYAGEGDKQPMIEDSKGNIIIPGLGGIIFRVNSLTLKVDSFNLNTDPARPIVPKAICTALYEDSEGIFWIGTQDGFARIAFSNIGNPVPQIKWYYNNSNNRNSLNYDHVSCFMNDPKEPATYLWICTKGGGLNRFNKKTGDFLHLTTKEGLPDDVVYGILSDDAGNIWGSTNRGVFCLLAAKQTNTSPQWVFRNFTKAYGLQDDEFNTTAYMKLPNGNLAFGGVNGLNIFDPKQILSRGFTPNVFITDIMVNNTPVVPGDKTGVLKSNIEETTEITLNHLQDILTLEFASLDFTAPNQNRYRYQLVGADKDWVESGERRTATYLHLPPGSYTFNVQGSNSQGIWSDKLASLRIIVLPPWWRSWWAYLCYAVLLAFGIRTYFKFSVNRAKLKSQLSFEQREAKRIKEIDSLKTHLYTNITHEFRTPLTVILGMANQVKKDPGEHFENGMNMIIRNGESLLKLVNEMLDLSKLETGKMSLQLVQGDIINFLRYVVESFSSLAESQHKQLHFLSEMDAYNMAYDPEKIRQIIANLLSNALKFTPEKGNIYISISEDKLADNNLASLVIKVKDTGVGIPEDQLQHIFDRFYQLDNSHTRKMEGTGIGLSLTKELVKLMEGEIFVKSPPTGLNKGTEFTVTIPVKKSASAVAARIDAKSIEPEQQKITETVSSQYNQLLNSDTEKPLILLVEDNADVVAYTASCLPDYRLAVGKDGREGFEIAIDIVPDLIITDIMMPFVDGFEMCRKLRKDERTSHIPVIMLTAKADIESRIEGLEQGADAYLEKPFHKEELLVRIRKLMEMRRSLQQYYFKRAGLTPAEPVATDVTEMIPAVNDVENEFVKKVRLAIEEHLEDGGFNVEQLCKLVFMSHSQLHRKLDALTGCSPNKFIRLIRLNKAKQLLKDHNLSIASIALDCGYNDPGYFTRVFKQEFGVTPQEWRTNN